MFDAAVADPDSLAEVPEVRALAGRSGAWSDEEWPEWEALNYVARTAYDRRTGEDEGLLDALEARGHESPEDPAPDDEPPTDDQAAYPRLLARFAPHRFPAAT